MARPLRIEYEGAFYHVTARGNEQKRIYYAKGEHDMEVTRRQYAMNAAGSRLFGVWDIAGRDTDMASAIGFRNATDKSMAVGITVGTRVFICDNHLI